MKLKQFESYLSQVVPFEAPKIEFEQYPTSPHIASRILYTADQVYGDVEDKMVCDLGCGTAMLSIGASILGSAYTLGVDIDPDALKLAQQNVENMEIDDIDFIRGNVIPDDEIDGEGAQGKQIPLLKPGSFDTVVMNPPFGTRRKGADVQFLLAALQLSNHAVYSLHKTSTREFLQKKATRDWGVTFEVIAQLRFDIPKMYKFHKKQSADVEVDLIRLCKGQEQQDS